MAVITGDLKEIGISHETVGNFTLFVKSKTDSNLSKGGLRNVADKNNVDGGGNMILQKNLELWSVDAVVIADTNTRKDLDKLNQLAAATTEANFTFVYIGQPTKGGTGQIVGDIVANTQDGNLEVTFMGGGELKDL